MQVAAARGAFLPACFPPFPSPSSFGEEDKKPEDGRRGESTEEEEDEFSPFSFLFFPRNNERWSEGRGQKRREEKTLSLPENERQAGGERRKVEQHRVGFHKANLFGKGNIGQRIFFPFRNPRVRNTGKCNSSNVYEIFALNYMKPSSPSFSFLHPPSPPFASN